MKEPTCDIVHRLDQSKFGKAIEILSKEQTANKLTRVQRFLFRLLTIAAYGALILFMIFIVLSVFRPALPKLKEEMHAYTWWLNVQMWLIYGLSALLVCMPLFLLLNFSLLRKAWRQAQLIRKLNLWKLYSESWRAQKKKQRFLRLSRLLIACIGVPFLLLVIVERKHAQPSDLLVWLVFGLVMIGVYLILLWKHKMDIMMNVDNLKQSLVQYRDAAESDNKAYIEVPCDQMAQIARIEVSQIARERAAAITGMIEGAGSVYTSRRSKTFQESASSIGAEDRLAIEERIEGLLDDPRPQEAVPSDDQRTVLLHIPGTQYALTYAVDHSLRQIDLLSLQSSTGDTQRRTSIEGMKNA